MSMQIVVGSIVAAALALLFLLIPVIALQTLLRLIAPTAAGRLPATGDRADYVPVDEGRAEERPTRRLKLLRTES